MNKLIFIELNEINFNLVSKYIEKYPKKYKNFERLYSLHNTRSTSEIDYHELEPWIQWVSAHTGKKFDEHKIFRLGDIVNSNHSQIFEEVESKGYRVGAISPMNARNSLNDACYFVPDPWTKTMPSNNLFVKMLSSVLKQTVNDNSKGTITAKSIFYILILFLRFMKLKDYPNLFYQAIKSRGKSWRKALFLDTFVHKIHLKLLTEKKPDFTTVFLNAGAHIQHHYLFNSEFSSKSNPNWYIDQKHDPFEEMLYFYDKILGDYLNINGYESLIVTGLNQKEFDEPQIYWRLANHEQFLKKLNIEYKDVHPRMTRDFLITFDSISDLKNGIEKLSSIRDSEGNRFFGIIDERESSLFVTLTYPYEIKDKEFHGLPSSIKISNEIVFVAVKNGEHDPNGEIFSSFDHKFTSADDLNVSKVHTIIDEFFEQA